MRRSLYISILCGFSMLLNTACKKDKLVTYNAADNIYFNYIGNADPSRNYLGVYADTLAITFAFRSDNVQDTLLGIPVAVTGLASDHDRQYSVSVDPSSTAMASKHYELPSSFVIHAGKINDSLFVRFKRTADLKTTPVSLKLRLVANDQFKTQLEYKSTQPHDITSIGSGDTVRLQTFKLVVSDMLAAGPYWNTYSYYFGDFSEKKVRLINQIAGMPLDFWSIDPTLPDQIPNTMHYGGVMFRYLSDMAFAGNTIFEADGITPLQMGYFFH